MILSLFMFVVHRYVDKYGPHKAHRMGKVIALLLCHLKITPIYFDDKKKLNLSYHRESKPSSASMVIHNK